MVLVRMVPVLVHARKRCTSFNFQVSRDLKSENTKDELNTSPSSVPVFGKELQSKTNFEANHICGAELFKEDSESDEKHLKNEISNKTKCGHKLLRAILDELLQLIPEVSLLKRVTSLCSRGDKDKLKILLSQNQNIESKTFAEALNNSVCKSGQFYDISKLLLDHGASVDAQDDEGNTALHYAVEYYPTNKLPSMLMYE